MKRPTVQRIADIAFITLAAGALAALLAACQPGGQASNETQTQADQVVSSGTQGQAQAPSPFQPSASVQEIMDAIVDPNADGLWNSVASISTREGTQEIQPHTDEEWKVVRRYAVTLVEVSNLLAIEGRRAAPEGTQTSASEDELNAAEIEQAMKAHRQDFVARAHGLHEAALEALAAVDRKDAQGLITAGGKLEHACEQCHAQFWYPKAKWPSLDTNNKL